MKELLFTNHTSRDKKRRELTISELTEKDGMVRTIMRRCSYYVKKQTEITQPVDLDELAVKGADGEKAKFREFHILRYHDSQLHEDKFSWKVDGSLFIVTSENLFTIDFSHSFEVDMVERAKAKG